MTLFPRDDSSDSERGHGFYKDVLTNWQQFLEAISSTNVITMPLWYYPPISKSGLFVEKMYANACVHIADVYNGTGELLSCNDRRDLYHHQCNFIDYHRLKTGLSNYRNHQNFNEPVTKPIQPAVIQILKQNIKGTQKFYNILIREKTEYNYSDILRK